MGVKSSWQNFENQKIILNLKLQFFLCKLTIKHYADFANYMFYKKLGNLSKKNHPKIKVFDILFIEK